MTRSRRPWSTTWVSFYESVMKSFSLSNYQSSYTTRKGRKKKKRRKSPQSRDKKRYPVWFQTFVVYDSSSQRQKKKFWLSTKNGRNPFMRCKCRCHFLRLCSRTSGWFCQSVCRYCKHAWGMGASIRIYMHVSTWMRYSSMIHTRWEVTVIGGVSWTTGVNKRHPSKFTRSSLH